MMKTSDVQQLLKEITPRQLEYATANGMVSAVSEEKGIPRGQLLALKDRWGITRRTAREALGRVL